MGAWNCWRPVPKTTSYPDFPLDEKYAQTLSFLSAPYSSFLRPRLIYQECLHGDDKLGDAAGDAWHPPLNVTAFVGFLFTLPSWHNLSARRVWAARWMCRVHPPITSCTVLRFVVHVFCCMNWGFFFLRLKPCSHSRRKVRVCCFFPPLLLFSFQI